MSKDKKQDTAQSVQADHRSLGYRGAQKMEWEAQAWGICEVGLGAWTLSCGLWEIVEEL